MIDIPNAPDVPERPDEIVIQSGWSKIPRFLRGEEHVRWWGCGYEWMFFTNYELEEVDRCSRLRFHLGRHYRLFEP